MNYFSLALILAILTYHALYHWLFLAIWGVVVAVYWGMNRKYQTQSPNSPYQKWKMASFHDGGDPCVYSREIFDLTDTEAFIETFNKENPNSRITLTHLCARALGATLSETQRNCGVISAGHFAPVESIDISVLVDIGGNNLGTVLVKDCGRHTLPEISHQLHQSVAKMKRGKDETLNNQMQMLKRIPSSLMQALARVIGFISYDLGLSVPALKIKRHNFGMGIITNVMGMNLRDAIAPLVPFLKPVVVVVMNEPFLKPIVVGNEVKIRKVMFINTSFDHRFADGTDAAKMFRAFRKVFNSPQNYVSR
jgi:pyruvate/2-oxoglutarate dehydrogenase complex dihydrolipoamide acyltransferase (E2) component